MDYLLTEEQVMIRDLARQIAEERIVPVRAHLDETLSTKASFGQAVHPHRQARGRCIRLGEQNQVSAGISCGGACVRLKTSSEHIRVQ